jgi:hypothetical protein
MPRGRPISYSLECKNGHPFTNKTELVVAGFYIHKKTGKRYNTVARRCRICESEKVIRCRRKKTAPKMIWIGAMQGDKFVWQKREGV